MWKENYKVGVDIIDQQHHELFSRVTDFLSSIRKEGNWKDKQDKVKSTLSFMKDYVIVHFDDEEDYMRKIDYPMYKDHVKIHEDFKGEVYSFEKRFEVEGFNEELVNSFAGKLMAWLINHVATYDRKIADFAAENTEKGVSK